MMIKWWSRVIIFYDFYVPKSAVTEVQILFLSTLIHRQNHALQSAFERQYFASIMAVYGAQTFSFRFICLMLSR